MTQRFANVSLDINVAVPITDEEAALLSSRDADDDTIEGQLDLQSQLYDRAIERAAAKDGSIIFSDSEGVDVLPVDFAENHPEAV